MIEPNIENISHGKVAKTEGSMRWSGRRRSGNVQDRRGSGTVGTGQGLAVGGGVIGIIIAIDYFYTKKDVTDKMAGIKDYNLPAVLAWLIAVVGDFFTGNPLGLLSYKVGVSGINSLVIGAVAYLILSKCMADKKA